MKPNAHAGLALLMLCACADTPSTPPPACRAEGIALRMDATSLRVGDSTRVHALLGGDCPGGTVVWSSSDSSVLLPESVGDTTAMLHARGLGAAQLLAHLRADASLSAVWPLSVADTTPPEEPPPGPLTRDLAAFLQTDTLEYWLTWSPWREGRIYQGDIPFVYTNARADTVWVPNCHQTLQMILQRQGLGGWRTIWGSITPACLSAPIVILPGESWSDTLHIHGGTEGSNVGPPFPSGDLEGIYRLVWLPLVSAYDPSAPGSGPLLPLEERVSNRFLVRIREEAP